MQRKTYMIKIKKHSNGNEQCLDEFISRLNTIKQTISKFENRSIKITQTEMQKEKKNKLKKKQEKTIQEMWDNIKWPDTCIIRIPEEKKEQGRIYE